MNSDLIRHCHMGHDGARWGRRWILSRTIFKSLGEGRYSKQINPCQLFYRGVLPYTMTADEKRQQMSGSTGGLSRVLVPKMPYVPPPTDPRQTTQWYERFYREHEAWRERVNQQFDNSAAVTALE